MVPQSVPAPNDWMAPHDLLSYDINHSDGFRIIGANQSVRFVSGDLPAFTGTLSKVLSTFMGYKSNIYKSPVYKGDGRHQRRFRRLNGPRTRNSEKVTFERPSSINRARAECIGHGFADKYIDKYIRLIDRARLQPLGASFSRPLLKLL